MLKLILRKKEFSLLRIHLLGVLDLFHIYDPLLPLYHGTINLYADLIQEQGIKIFPRNKGSVDFGAGFYLTTNYDQAREWAKRRTEKPIPSKQLLELSKMTVRDFLGMKESFKPVVLKFEIENIDHWLKLNYKIFKNANEDWKQFVSEMRRGDLAPSNEWIYGPVADGGLLSENYQDIRAYNNKDQLAVLTEKAVKHLNMKEVIKCL